MLTARMLVLLAAWLSAAAFANDTVQHELAVRLDPAKGTLEVRDRITLPAAGTARFTLNAGLEPRAAGYTLREIARSAGGGELRAYRVELPAGGRTFELSYQGRLADGGGAALSADNAVLDPSSGWYADFGGRPVRFDLRVRLPDRWHCVSQGKADRVVATGEERWTAATPQQGIYLVAAAFVRYQRDTPWGRGEVFLRSENEAMAQAYLDATAAYLRLYSRLIGPYPYPKFALVENAQQTGYGMPSFTLLGSRVIRLPFIVQTSYPHEILHNWWGNGVWVAYEGGNWAEALTTYLSDYLLAERRGHGVQQRRAALQKYADFVAAHNDFPLREFRARHGEASQAIGYSKGMMFFHMLRRQLGDVQFLDALRAFYRQFQFRAASFDDLEAVFEHTSGRKLDAEFRQWLQRSGAPELSLGSTAVDSTGNGYRVRVTLRQRQAGPVYRLEIPLAVQVEGQPTASLHTVVMEQREQTFELRFAAKPLQLAVDPTFDLFRRLDPGELPPSLGRLQGAQRAVYVLPSAAPAAMRTAYSALARAWARAQDRIVGDTQVAGLTAGDAIWVLGRENRLLPQVRAAARGLPLHFDAEDVVIEGRSLDLSDHSIVLVTASAEPKASVAWISASSPAAVAALARKLPHYSRYGYLAFAAPETRNVLKGEWPLTGSPLQRLLADAASGPLSLPVRAPLDALLGADLHAPP